MSQSPGSFRPSELDGSEQRAGDADLAGAYAIARELEASLPIESIGPSVDFTDRVMAAVAREPAPRAAGFLAVLRDRPGLAGLVASVREAWAVVAGGPGRPVRARGLALAYVLAVLVIGTSLTGVATYGAAGALGLLDGDASPTPTVLESIEPSTTPAESPSPTPTPAATPTPMPTPTESVEPGGSVEPSESVEPDGSSEPDESDDHGGDMPAASDDGESSSGSSSGGDDESADPSDTPRPSDTPKPSQTPN
jgi:hypothetical protein